MSNSSILSGLIEKLSSPVVLRGEPQEEDIDIVLSYDSKTDSVQATCKGRISGSVTSVLGGFSRGADEILSGGGVNFEKSGCGPEFDCGFFCNDMKRFRSEKVGFIIAVVSSDGDLYLGDDDILIP